jgi:HEPN domain-containing protein
MAEDLNVQDIIDHWIESSDEDYKTMIDLFRTKNYGWAVFHSGKIR